MTRIYDPAIEWVPIESGQMPEKKYVLITATTETNLVPFTIEACFVLARGFFTDIELAEILAWRYLPEPYRPIAVDESVITFENGSKINLVKDK
jgi:hypothetical protein